MTRQTNQSEIDMRSHRLALLAVLALGMTAGVGCKVIEDSDSDRQTTTATEENVDVHALPINVSAAVKGVLPSGTITKAEKESRRGKLVYNLAVKDGEKKYDMLVTPDGTILSTKQRGS